MVIVPDKFIYLATPRTGSRAIAAALMQVEGAKEFKEHHVHPEDVALSVETLVKGAYDLPKYTVIRDPYSQVLSMYYHVVGRHLERLSTAEDFKTFIDVYRGAWWFNKELYPYKSIADEVFIYEPDLQITMDAMAYTARIWPTPIVHRVTDSPSPDLRLLTSDTREAINGRFNKCIAYYNDLLERY